MDSVPKETDVVSVMTQQPLGTVALARDEKDDRLLPHPIRRQRLTARDKNPQRNQATKRKALKIKGAKVHADSEFVRKKKHHENFGFLPRVKTTSLGLDANMEEHVSSDMLSLRRSPARIQRKVVRKDQLHHWRSLIQFGLRVSRLSSEKVYST